MNNFYYALSLLETLYDITLKDDLFEEIALLGWEYIGNKRTRIYRTRLLTDELGEVELPCNCDIIEAVTTDFEEWDYVNNVSPEGDLNSQFTEAYIENRKRFNDTLYASGKFVKYERVGNKLHVYDYNGYINILYKGIELDEEGLPSLTDKEAIALATYCAYITTYKEGLKSKNANIINLASNLLLKWNTQVDLARVDYYMSQNEWDLVLDAKTNWDRKQYNKSLKLYR